MRSLTAEVIAALEAHGLTTGKGVGGKTVDGTFQSFTPPFAVVYPLIQTRDGSFEDPFADVRKWFEIVGEGITQEQAEWVADEVEEALRASSLVLVDITVARVARDDATAASSRWKSWTRAEIRTHAPTGAT